MRSNAPLGEIRNIILRIYYYLPHLLSTRLAERLVLTSLFATRCCFPPPLTWRLLSLPPRLPQEQDFSSPEEFALGYAEKFLSTYPFMSKVTATVVQVPWVRATVDGKAHNHAFTQGPGEERWSAHAVAERGRPTTVESCVRGLVLLKTTQSGWERFHRNEYSLLPGKPPCWIYRGD